MARPQFLATVPSMAGKTMQSENGKSRVGIIGWPYYLPSIFLSNAKMDKAKI